MMNYPVFVSAAVLLLTASPVLANYPCPGGPGPGEQQIGVGGGSHGIASVPLCAAGSSGGYGGYGDYSIMNEPPPSYDPLVNVMTHHIMDMMNAQTNALAGDSMPQANSMSKPPSMDKRQQMEADPEYQRYKQGSWQFFKGNPNALPGDSCTALWTKEGGLVSITGPGANYEGGMLTFWSPNIPKPAATQTVAVTLKQSQYQPQSVNALNFSVPNIPFGAIALTVPTIDAALNTMLDVEQFQLEMGGHVVADVGWTDGLAARARLQQCINSR